MPLRHVTIYLNQSRPGVPDTAEAVTRRLSEAGVAVAARRTPQGSEQAVPDFDPATDLIITLGGDGTILAASRGAAPLGLPILGVHMGRFGFIAEVHPDDLMRRLDDLLAGRFAIQDRVMAQGEVWRRGECVHRAVGLNDVVLSRGAMTRMLQLSTQIGEGPCMEYMADGVIVATPTGSTAYALSAGGPLMDPTVRALLVVPICPHTLAARPIVVPDTEEITFLVETDGGEVTFAADSASVYLLQGRDTVRVSRSEYTTRLVVFRPASFYEKVHERLLWGERVNE